MDFLGLQPVSAFCWTVWRNWTPDSISSTLWSVAKWSQNQSKSCSTLQTSPHPILKVWFLICCVVKKTKCWKQYRPHGFPKVVSRPQNKRIEFLPELENHLQQRSNNTFFFSPSLGKTQLVAKSEILSQIFYDKKKNFSIFLLKP